MCGICGVINKDTQKPVERGLIERMTDAITHRGPDDCGYYFYGNVGMGHRRLSIVDLKLGHQPISNEDGTLWIAYNGEIYNHADLRKDLERAGHRYKTNSDTETIIHCYEEYGAEALQKIRGMFALALFDQSAGRLFLARDRLGIKPLYYIDTPKYFAFASEIKALLAIEEIKRDLNYQALLQILALKYTCDSSTLFQGITKLDPGHYLTLDREQLLCARYWDIDRILQNREWVEQDAVERMHQLLDESVQLRLMADVPLGMFLSGGIDSTVISARMAKMVNRPISTFSVAFREREANELHYARIAARHAGADHHEITITTEDFFNSLPNLIYHEDEPIAHPSSVALNFVSRLARQHVKVVLTGEGSDELFGGYEKYYQTLYNIKADRILFSLFPKATRPGLFRPMLDALPYKFPLRNKAVRTTVYLDPDIETIFLDNYATFSRDHLRRLIQGDVWNSVEIANVYNSYMEHFNRPEEYSLLNRLLYADIKTYLLELLMKQDQMSMAASIESRVPFLDHHLVEFAFTLPESLKIRCFNTKRILRMAFGKEIPEEILHRAKAGFPVPIKRWFAGECHSMAKKIILGKNSLCRQIMSPKTIEQLFDLHRLGKYNYSDQIWTLLNIEIWHSIFLKRQPIETIRLEAS